MLKIKLNHVLIVPFATLITAIVLVLGILAWQFYQDSTQQLGRKLNEIASPLVQERLTNYLQDARVAHYSVKNEVDKIIVNDGEFNTLNQIDLREHIKQTLEKTNTVNTIKIAYSDCSYMGIGKYPDGSLVSKIASDNDKILNQYKLPERKLISQTPNYSACTRAWFKKTGQSNSYWSPVYQNFSNRKESEISLSQSIYTRGGQFLGVVGSDILLKDISKKLNDMLVTNNTFIFIIDGKRSVIAQSQIGANGTKNLANTNELLTQTVQLIENNPASKDQFNLPSIEIFDTVQMTLNNEKDTYYINFIPYGQKEGLNWYIGIVIPESDFFGHIDSVKTNFLVVLLVTFFTTLLMGLLVTRFINKSIQKLQHNVDCINSNVSEPNLEFQSIKEIDDLSESFMRMSRRLQASYHQLRKNNEQLEETIELRTKQLTVVNKKLIHQSTTDQLTQIANKRAFEQAFDSYWQMLQAGKLTTMAFLICDIDFFKPYNDHYGHLEGDKCIYTVAQTMKSTIGRHGMVARFGGEEFVIMIPNAKLKDIHNVFHALKVSLANKKLPHAKSTVSEYVTLSYGASLLTSTQKITSEGIRYELSTPTQQQVMSAADKALYHAKENGRDRGVIAR